MKKEYREYIRRVRSFIPANRIYTDDLRCLVWGTDAGFYRHLPQVVIRSANETEVSRLLAAARAMRLPVTFRAAGTSLSGQAITDSILIVAGKHWERYLINDDASLITLEPGLVGAEVDAILAPLGRTFTPDPASKNSAMVGGIVMNNASGMSCGTHANSDRILRSARLVLTDGTILDTGDSDSRNAFRQSHPDFIKAIEQLRDEIMADTALVERIRYKYSIKNVTGLNILPFVCFNDVFDIIAHLLVGSEGTLAFGSRFTMKTGHLYPYRASAMLYFSSMREACEAVVAMKKGPVGCAELLDKKSLASVGDTTGKDLTAVLLQTFADSPKELDDNILAIKETLRPFPLYIPAHFTSDAEEYGKYWAIRSGIFPAVGGTRPLGTTVIIEDVAFHIDDLPQATVDLADMLNEHGYDDCCIYGHALEGNYHFIIAQSFDTNEEIDRYRALMNEIVKLVVDKYDGSLKAEHGTGRNMAPFVAKEWGERVYKLMRRVKDIFDPEGILNPGVIFNDDPDCFVKDFKPLPLIDAAVDKCIECGFCEVNCVSCGFGLSSRQRIIARREIARLGAAGDDPRRRSLLERQYKYYGDELCAADGLCGTSCPMHINTGDMTHHLRACGRKKGGPAYRIGLFCCNHFGGVRQSVKGLLYVAAAVNAVIGDKATTVIGSAMHAMGLPLWTPSLPRPTRARALKKDAMASPAAREDGNEKTLVYFPSCLNQTMGRAAKGPHNDLIDEVVSLFKKAGWRVIIPDNIGSLCCGMIWESKGLPEEGDMKSAQLEATLLKASRNGELPVVCDQSPCLHRMREHFTTLRPYELLEFIADKAADSLVFHTTDEPIAVHLTCSTRLMGIGDKVIELARRCSTHVLLPKGVGCCAFAGDKGFTHPELNAYALRKLREQIDSDGIRRGFTNSRTCEIGLTANSGIPYQSLVYLINECTDTAST